MYPDRTLRRVLSTRRGRSSPSRSGNSRGCGRRSRPARRSSSSRARTSAGRSRRACPDHADRARAGGARPPRLPQPRARRRPRRRTARSTASAAAPTRCSTPPRRRGSARSTPPARTAGPRSSWGSGCAAPPRRRDRRAPSGATCTPPAGRSRPTRPRSRTTTPTRSGRQLGGDARAPRGPARRSTRSTRRRRTAACSRTTRCWPRARERRAARRQRERHGAAGDVGARGRTRDVRRRPGDVEPARARRRPGARGRARRGLTVYVKEALANGRLARSPAPGLVEAARHAETTPDALALAAVLAQPWADVVLSGAATGDTLRSNLRGARCDVERFSLTAACGVGRGERGYWSRRSELAWT